SWSPSAGLNNPNISNPTVTVSGTTTSTTSYIVTASNGSCIISDTVLVSVSPPPVASFSATDACSGISVPVSFTGSAPPGAVYSWNFGGGAVLSGSGAGPYTVSYPSAGNYTVALQVTVGACTSIAPNQTISIHPSLLPPQAVVSDVTCSGIPNGSIQVSPLGGTGPFQISWSPNVSATFTANSLAAGNYTATVTDVNGCTSTASYPVYEPFPLVAVATGVPALCAGSPSGTVSVSAQGGSTPYSYSWLNGGATTSAISGLLAGNYTCMVTDANGCTTSAMANVAPQITVIPVALATPATICPGENVSLQVTGGLSYSWSDGATDSIRVVNPGSTTQYSVIATDQNGCTGSDSLIVQVAQQPQALFSVQPVCFEDTSSFKQQSSVSSGIISNYSWNFGDGNTSAGTQPKHFYPTPGTYPVTLVVNTNAGCVDSLTLYAVVHPLPIANWTSGLQYGCIPLPVDFTAQTVNGVSYQWAFGSLIGNESSPTVIFDQPGKYSVMLSVTDANGCTDDTLTEDYVEAYPVPESGFFINPNYVTELMPRVELMDASLGAVDWYWDFGDTTVSSDREPSHTYAYPGTYEIRQVVRNNFGCIDTLVRTLEVGRDYAFYIPNAFTPNGDGTNDFFEVKGYNYFGYRIEIFNRWGKQVFISENPEVSWDGSQRGEHAQQGVYDYAVDFKDVFGKPHKLFGRVTVIR
ncbi:MAG: PKD domain-containing protein, partial [Bacteroidota bacterium]